MLPQQWFVDDSNRTCNIWRKHTTCSSHDVFKFNARLALSLFTFATLLILFLLPIHSFSFSFTAKWCRNTHAMPRAYMMIEKFVGLCRHVHSTSSIHWVNIFRIIARSSCGCTSFLHTQSDYIIAAYMVVLRFGRHAIELTTDGDKYCWGQVIYVFNVQL